MGIAAAGDGCAEVEAGTGHETGDEGTGSARSSDRSVCAEEGVGGPAGNRAQKRGRHGDRGCGRAESWVVNWLERHELGGGGNWN